VSLSRDYIIGKANLIMLIRELSVIELGRVYCELLNKGRGWVVT
jgi:hypothetical protein